MPIPDPRRGGQALPLFAIVAPVILAFMALGLDAAQAFVERRHAQGAADLAALAGARHLHEDVTSTEQEQARDKARSIALANGYPSAQVTVTTPYDGDVERILVTIDSEVDTFFMPVLDFFVPGDRSTVEVDARAAAYGGYEESTAGGFAIFALESCPSLEKTVDISGSNSQFIGRIHSNSDVYISGSDMTVTGATTHSCGDGYPSFHDGGGGNTFIPSPTTGPQAPVPEPDPVSLRWADFTCDWTAPSSGTWDLSNNGPWWVGGTKISKTLRAGTYCSRTGSSDGIKLSDSNILIESIVSGPGGVTFVAKSTVEISGSNFILQSHEHDVLIYSEGTSDVAVKLSASGGVWQGLIYAPFGTAEVSGQSNWTYSGGIVSKRVKLNGSDANITGLDALGGPGEQVIALTE